MSDKKVKAELAEEELKRMEEELVSSPEENPEVSEEDSTSETDSPTENEKSIEEESEDEVSSTESEEEDQDKVQLQEKSRERFHKLANEKKRLAEENEQLKQKLREESLVKDMNKGLPEVPRDTAPDLSDKVNRLPWEDQERPEITPEEYQKHVTDTAQRIVDARLAEKDRKEALTRRIWNAFEADVSKVQQEYPELNETSESFDKDLATKIAVRYKKEFQREVPSGKYVSFKAYVDDLMSIRNKGVEDGRKKMSDTITKQKATQPITDSGSPPTRKDIKQQLDSVKTIEELEALEKSLPSS